MNQNGSSGADALQTMAVSFVVAAVLAAALLVDFNGHGRLLDTLLGRKDDWGSQVPRVTRVEAQTDAGGKMMVIGDPAAPEPASASASASASVASAAPARYAAAKPDWRKHIQGSLQEYDIKGPATQHSAASASVNDAAPAAAAPAPSAAPAATVAALPTAGAHPAATAQPAYVNYGSASRSDIMSSASGPVYNFTGKKR